jgi:hypothetical protein
LGALIEGLIGPRAPAAPADPGQASARVQVLTLFALRTLALSTRVRAAWWCKL